MKVIDLLTRVGQKKQIPYKIKYQGNYYIYDNAVKVYTNEITHSALGYDFKLDLCLNDEIEIIEEVEKPKNYYDEMVKKAEYELELLLKNCKDEESLKMQKIINNNILDIVKLFSKQGHSGFTASYCIPIIGKLLNQSFITPLTGNDDEWTEVSPGLFQNVRESSIFKSTDEFDGKPYWLNGKAFSDDGGQSYYTNRDSWIPIEFPLKELPKIEYIILGKANNE